jgi:hypothetical protein
MSESKPLMLSNKTWIILFFALAVSISSVFLMKGIFEAKPNYLNGPYIEMPLGAPNGLYSAEPMGFNDTSVTFPLCSCAFGNLHGLWNYDNSSGLVFFLVNHPCVVMLESNVIVETWTR